MMKTTRKLAKKRMIEKMKLVEVQNKMTEPTTAIVKKVKNGILLPDTLESLPVERHCLSASVIVVDERTAAGDEYVFCVVWHCSPDVMAVDWICGC